LAIIGYKLMSSEEFWCGNRVENLSFEVGNADGMLTGRQVMGMNGEWNQFGIMYSAEFGIIYVTS
jgi:hypothetical protein